MTTWPARRFPLLPMERNCSGQSGCFTTGELYKQDVTARARTTRQPECRDEPHRSASDPVRRLPGTRPLHAHGESRETATEAPPTLSRGAVPSTRPPQSSMTRAQANVMLDNLSRRTTLCCFDQRHARDWNDSSVQKKEVPLGTGRQEKTNLSACTHLGGGLHYTRYKHFRCELLTTASRPRSTRDRCARRATRSSEQRSQAPPRPPEPLRSHRRL